MVVFFAAIALGAVALVALVVFVVVEPAEGSTSSNVIGGIAAASGILTGLAFATGAVYAQVKGLWPRVSAWLRMGMLAMLAMLFLVSLLTRD